VSEQTVGNLYARLHNAMSNLGEHPTQDRVDFLLARIQDAIEEGGQTRRIFRKTPIWEPLWRRLERNPLWPNDEAVLLDLAIARVAIRLLSDELASFCEDAALKIEQARAAT